VTREQGDNDNDSDDNSNSNSSGVAVVTVDQKRGTGATSSAIFATGVMVGAVATFFLGSSRR
jgi:hypothetical protein